MKFLNITENSLTEVHKTSITYVSDLKNKILSSDGDIIQNLEEINNETSKISNYFELCKNFSTDLSIRTLASKCYETYTKNTIDLLTDQTLYNALEEYNVPEHLGSWYKYLYERFREKKLSEMKRCGLHLDNDTMNKVKDISKTLTELSSKYGSNLNEFNDTLSFTKQELEGLPESWFTDDKKIDINENPNLTTYKVTSKYPDVHPIQDFCKNRDVRKKVYQMFSGKCFQENKLLLEETLLLKDKKAKLLGYKTHAHLKTDDKLIKTPENALEFLDSMNKLFSTKYNKEINELTNFSKQEGFTGDILESWDKSYYLRLYKEKKTDLDNELLRTKFPVKKVVSGMLDIYQELLEYRFELQNDEDKFHHSVEVYKVYDTESLEEMGKFYLDLFTREGKYSHAAVFSYTPPHFNQTTHVKQLPSGVMGCNFSNDNLYFSEVETLFHEFGHMMHLISCKPEHILFSYFDAFSCEWDFVETPSQTFEYWCYEQNPLLKMSEGLTEDDIIKIKKNKNILPTLHYKRQLMFALYDMKLHCINYETDTVDAVKLWLDIEQDVIGHVSEGTVRVGSFGHIMSGYDAGYYGYLRSETFSANLFYVLFKGDEMNKNTGKMFRKLFLGAGATYNAVDLVEKALNLTLTDDSNSRKIDDSWFIKALQEK